jgi:uncharacterized protein YgiM (DUF1202 family)
MVLYERGVAIKYRCRLADSRKMTLARKVRVGLSFPPNFFEGLAQPPLVMRRGEALEVVEDEKSEEWPAFVLVVNQKGERGWVPKRYLKREGNKALAIKGYDTTTLNPVKGEILTVLEADEESGWLWCRDGSGNAGWFAVDHLE